MVHSRLQLSKEMQAIARPCLSPIVPSSDQGLVAICWEAEVEVGSHGGLQMRDRPSKNVRQNGVRQEQGLGVIFLCSYLPDTLKRS